MLFVYGFSEEWELCGVDVETTVTIIVATLPTVANMWFHANLKFHVLFLCSVMKGNVL